MTQPIHYNLNTSLNSLAPMGFLNGGPGSGNFGHAGRKGVRGGSMSRHAVAGGIAEESIKQAGKEEKKTTADLVNVANQHGARMVGLEARIKRAESLTRKIITDAESDKSSPMTKEKLLNSAKKIHDNLRYTMIMSDQNFGNTYQSVKNDLEKSGYKFVKVKNTMGNTDGTYRGVNTQVKNANGYTFELQFHTTRSFQTKSEQHKNYEIVRNPKKYSAREIEAANRTMKLAYQSLPTPKGLNLIPSFSETD